MNFINKLERKYGRYSINNLPAIMIALYVAGYLISMFSPRMLYYLTLDPYYIFRGQIWRLITWVLIPPGTLDIFTVIMLFFYFSIGKTLERTWGSFRFNLYVLSGIFFTIIGSMLLYGLLFLQLGIGVPLTNLGVPFSTFYINMSMFLAFAAAYPDMQVLLYFIIPIKVKWMGIIYGVFIIYDFFQTNWIGKVAIFASLLNFIIFFVMTRNLKRFRPKEIHRRQEFKKNVAQSAPGTGPKHRCAVCGRTELDGDHLEFRYCSKCDGAYEYCQDHLFTHEHKHKA